MGLEAGEVQITDDNQWLLAAEAMGLNYRVGADEINCLQLFTTGNLEKIFGAIVDMPTILAIEKSLADAQKKTADRPPATGAG